MKRILIVDDDNDLSTVIKEIFSAEGFATMVVPDAHTAIVEFHSWKPHVVILDYDMPGMKGNDALKAMRRLNPSIPVIMLTGKCDPEIQAETLAWGAFKFLCKPPDYRELISTAGEALGGNY